MNKLINPPRDKVLSPNEVIAFYLPQFHEHPRNSEMWKPGFTDWDTTLSARPLFLQHKQPKSPGKFGRYDLKKTPEIMESQYKYAQELGITGFSFYHYRFSNKERALDFPIKYLKSSKLSLRYMISWVNVNWTKSWVGDHKTILHSQTYDFKDIPQFARELVDYFNDTRYIHSKGRPLLYIHSPKDAPDGYLDELVYEIKKISVDPYIISPAKHVCKNSIKICDNLMAYPPGDIPKASNKEFLFKYITLSLLTKLNNSEKLRKALFQFSNVNEYEVFAKNYTKYLIKEKHKDKDFIPTFLSGWDNTPRYGYRGTVLQNYSLKHLQDSIIEYLESTNNNDIIFLKSWNEWAEGNVLEPTNK